MIGLIWQLLVPYGLRIASWFAIIGAVLVVLFGARQAGRNAERVERLRRTIEVQREQLDAAARRPRDRAELIGRMRNGNF